MRSRQHMVLCVRNPNADIVTSVEKLNPLADQYKPLGWMFIRGIVTLFESLYLGIKGLLFSANVAIEDENQSAQGNEQSGDSQGISHSQSSRR